MMSFFESDSLIGEGHTSPETWSILHSENVDRSSHPYTSSACEDIFMGHPNAGSVSSREGNISPKPGAGGRDLIDLATGKDIYLSDDEAFEYAAQPDKDALKDINADANGGDLQWIWPLNSLSSGADDDIDASLGQASSSEHSARMGNHSPQEDPATWIEMVPWAGTRNVGVGVSSQPHYSDEVSRLTYPNQSQSAIPQPAQQQLSQLALGPNGQSQPNPTSMSLPVEPSGAYATQVPNNLWASSLSQSGPGAGVFTPLPASYIGPQPQLHASITAPILKKQNLPYTDVSEHQYLRNSLFDLRSLKEKSQGFRNGVWMHDVAQGPNINNANRPNSIQDSRFKLFERIERFMAAAECIYQELRFHATSQSGNFRQFYHSVNKLEKVLATGFDTLIGFWDGVTPTVLEHICCFLHVIDAILRVMNSNPARSMLSNAKFTAGLAIFRQCLFFEPTQEDEDPSSVQKLFDEIVYVMSGKSPDGPTHIHRQSPSASIVASSSARDAHLQNLWNELRADPMMAQVEDYLNSLSEVGTVFSYLCGPSLTRSCPSRHPSAVVRKMRDHLIRFVLKPLESQGSHDAKIMADIASTMLEAGFIDTIRELEAYLIGLIKVRRRPPEEFSNLLKSVIEWCQSSYRAMDIPSHCRQRAENDAPDYQSDDYLTRKWHYEEAWYKREEVDDVDALQGEISSSIGPGNADGHFPRPFAVQVNQQNGASTPEDMEVEEEENPSMPDKGKQVASSPQAGNNHPSTPMSSESTNTPDTSADTPEEDAEEDESSFGPTTISCPICGQTASHRSNLNRHIQTRHGGHEDQEHVCGIDGCDFTRRGFRGLGNVKTHKAEVHKIREIKRKKRTGNGQMDNKGKESDTGLLVDSC
ncbi:hypothetical protein TWF696_009661 [Orbilia brochopaga]|uniref:C2H2-type domain-containing protein n=1 Tax=Orbilia brochopaga TaxID=3140254 RepID=A0AAV9UFG1_9PEZI